MTENQLTSVILDNCYRFQRRVLIEWYSNSLLLSWHSCEEFRIPHNHKILNISYKSYCTIGCAWWKIIIGLLHCIRGKNTNARCHVIPFMRLYYTDNVPLSPTYTQSTSCYFIFAPVTVLSLTFKAYLCVPSEHDCTVPNMCKRLNLCAWHEMENCIFLMFIG